MSKYAKIDTSYRVRSQWFEGALPQTTSPLVPTPSVKKFLDPPLSFNVI